MDNSDSHSEQPKFVALEASTHVIKENGRWVVMLNVVSWDAADEHPITNNWKRINDYATEQDAIVAASWIAKSANRNIRPPMGF